MADEELRRLERRWKATGETTDGVTYFLAKCRSGNLVELGEFPIHVWHAIQAQYSLNTIAHHLTTGAPADENRLDINLVRWHSTMSNLRNFESRIETSPFRLIQMPSWDLSLLVSQAARHQHYKYSLVYYPDLPPHYRLVAYVSLLFTPEILTAGNPIRPFLQEMIDGDSLLNENGVGGMVLLVHFNPRGTLTMSPEYATHAHIGAWLQQDNTEEMLNNVADIYD